MTERIRLDSGHVLDVELHTVDGRFVVALDPGGSAPWRDLSPAQARQLAAVLVAHADDADELGAHEGDVLTTEPGRP